MERKIGEIFEYNGEWYQCVESQDGSCKHCDMNFEGKCPIPIKECTESGRSDKSYVIFKKLEKVGEPYVKTVSDGTSSTFQRYRVYNSVILPKEPYIYCNFIDGTIEIAIKETKEEKKLNLKPFDLESAKAGKPVCTRDGRKARIICFDGKGDKPIIALVEAKGNKDALIEKVERYFINGHSVFEVRETNNDLMMLPEKKEGWINVYKGGKLDADYIYPTKADAVENIFQPMKGNYIDTIKVNWSE